MRIRALPLAAVVAAGAFALALSCSGANPCASGDCGGCCDADGVCQDGAQPAACGVGGNACSTCSGAQQCVAGACVAGQQDAGSNPVAVMEMCGALPRAFCGAVWRCGGAGSIDGCLQTYPDLFSECERDFATAVKEGRATFDPAKGSACLSAIQAFDSEALDPVGACIPRDFFEEVEACRGALVGRVPLNGACYHHEECGDDAYCASAVGSCPGTCQQRRLKGASANSTRECVQGLYLYANGSCQERVAANGDCSPLAGTGSIQPQECVFGHVCSANVCVPYKKRNETCQLGQCKPLLACNIGSANPFCVLRSGVGGGCLDDRDCQLELICELPADGGTTRACVPKRAEFETCAEISDCRRGLYCPPGGGTCTAQKPVGEICAASHECQSFSCMGNPLKCQENACHDPSP